eukprot:GHVH01004805.1.p1 GENE.GHVH01004805.1~~GHVH01004805.1.p1  ORF type:complete len:1369 (+),score=268.82 GHVH01004805.1:205-4107(+)
MLSGESRISSTNNIETTTTSTITTYSTALDTSCEADLQSSTTQIEKGLESLINVQNEIKKLRHGIVQKEVEVQRSTKAYDSVREEYIKAQNLLKEERSKYISTLSELEGEKAKSIKIKEREREHQEMAKVLSSRLAQKESHVTDLEDDIAKLRDTESMLREKLKASNNTTLGELQRLKELYNKEMAALEENCSRIQKQYQDARVREEVAESEFHRQLDESRKMNCTKFNDLINSAKSETGRDISAFCEKVEDYAKKALNGGVSDSEVQDSVKLLHSLKNQLKEWSSSQGELSAIRSKFEKQISSHVSDLSAIRSSLGQLEARNQVLAEDQERLVGENTELKKIIKTNSQTVNSANYKMMKSEDEVARLTRSNKKANACIHAQEQLLQGPLKDMKLSHGKIDEMASKLSVIDRLQESNSKLLRERSSNQDEVDRLQALLKLSEKTAKEFQVALELMSDNKPPEWLETVKACTEVLSSNRRMIDSLNPVLFETDHHQPTRSLLEQYMATVSPNGGVESDIRSIEEASGRVLKVDVNAKIMRARMNDLKAHKDNISLMKQQHKASIDQLRSEYEDLMQKEMKKQGNILAEVMNKQDKALRQMYKQMEELNLEKSKLEGSLDQMTSLRSSSDTKSEFYAKELANLKLESRQEVLSLDVDRQLEESRGVVLSAKESIKDMGIQHARQVNDLNKSHAKELAKLQKDCHFATDTVIKKLNGVFKDQMAKLHNKESNLNSSLCALSSVIETLSKREQSIVNNVQEGISACTNSELIELKKALAVANAELNKRKDEPEIELPDFTEIKSIMNYYSSSMDSSRIEISGGVSKLTELAKQENVELLTTVGKLEKDLDAAKMFESLNQTLQAQITQLHKSLDIARTAIKNTSERSSEASALKSEVESLRLLISERPESRATELASSIEHILNSLLAIMNKSSEERKSLAANFRSISEGLRSLNKTALSHVSSSVVAEYVNEELKAKDAELLAINQRIKELSDVSGETRIDKSQVEVLQCRLAVAEAELERQTAILNSRQSVEKDSSIEASNRFEELNAKYKQAKIDLSNMRDEMNEFKSITEANVTDDPELSARVDALKLMYERTIESQQASNESDLELLRQEYEAHKQSLEDDNERLSRFFNSLHEDMSRQRLTIAKSLKDLESISSDNDSVINSFKELNPLTIGSEGPNLLSLLYKLAMKVVYRSNESKKRSVHEIYSKMEAVVINQSNYSRSATAASTIATNPLKRNTVTMSSNNVATAKQRNALQTPDAKRQKMGSDAFSQWAKNMANDHQEESGGWVSSLRGKLFTN